MTGTEIALTCTIVSVVIATLTFFIGRKSAVQKKGEEDGRRDRRFEEHEEQLQTQAKSIRELHESYIDIRQRLTLVEKTLGHIEKSLDQTSVSVESIRTRGHEIVNSLTAIQVKLDVVLRGTGLHHLNDNVVVEKK